MNDEKRTPARQPFESGVSAHAPSWTTQEQARLLIESVRDYAIFTLDPRGCISSWNPGAERIKGYKAHEVMGKHFSLFYPPEEVLSGKCERELVIAESEGHFQEEGWRVRKDSSRFWASVTVTALRAPSGQLVGFGKVTRDMTERLKQEEKLRESEERLRLLVESIKDYAVFMLEPTGHVATWNPGAERFKGYRAEEIIGQHISRFYEPEDVRRGKPQALLREAMEHGRVEDEGWRVRKDGSRFWADVVISAVRDPSGRLRGFSKVTRDLTERRQAEERIRQSEKRFRILIDQVKDYAIFMLDPAGHVVTWNKGAEHLKGYRPEEIIGESISRFYAAEDAQGGKAERELATALREGRFEEEGWRVRKDGSRFWANVILTPLYDDTGQHVGFTKVTRDLTERRKLEEERLRVAQVQESLRLRDEFLSIASHELKTPLTALQLQLQSMRERVEALDGRTAIKLDRASRSSERLADLIEALLDVSRISTGRLELSPQPFDLAEATHELVERLRDSAAKAGCELSLRAEASMPGTWDRLRIEQVLLNLVGNAIKYAAGAPIEVSLAREGETAVLEVRDRGPGIPEEALPRIFDRFERAAEMRHYGGLGLGLYIVREIIKAHDGMVTVRNLPDGGACFTVRLPMLPVISPEEHPEHGEAR
jgi:PAS domain S-box-containing protein